MYFQSRAVDEVALAREAAPYVNGLAGALPDRNLLARLCVLDPEGGNDLATMVLYQALLASPTHGAYIRSLDGQPLLPPGGAAFAPRRDVKLMIVPGLLNRRMLETGDDLGLLADVARRIGLPCETAPIDGRGSVQSNAYDIAAWLAQERAPRLVLASRGKGSADLRVALTRHAGPGVQARLDGWLNIAGFVQGSALVERCYASSWRRLFVRLFCVNHGIPFENLREAGATFLGALPPLALPSTLPVVNVVPLPLGCYVRHPLVGKHRLLGDQGPNDGVMLVLDMLYPGIIYPLWGADHFLRGTGVSALFHRLCRLILAGERIDLAAGAKGGSEDARARSTPAAGSAEPPLPPDAPLDAPCNEAPAQLWQQAPLSTRGEVAP